MSNDAKLSLPAGRLAELLRERALRIVFAESCTAGLVSAALGSIPGISEFHCGSAVVYRVGTKSAWLGVPPEVLDNPGPVSEIVAREMAQRVLLRTPEADLSASITGHFGPQAPSDQDGLVYIGFARRGLNDLESLPQTHVWERRLVTPMPVCGTPDSIGHARRERQIEAAAMVLSLAADQLTATG